jgi:hypothetical protein
MRVRNSFIASTVLFLFLATLASFFREDSVTFELTSTPIPEIQLTSDSEYLTNDEFKAKFNNTDSFKIDDTDVLKALRSVIEASPDVFGYSVEEGDIIFPPYEYPDCSAYNMNFDSEFVHLDFENSTFTMSCAGQSRGKYVIGPHKKYVFTNPRELEGQFKVRRFLWEPVGIKQHIEWVIASCRDRPFRFEMFQLKPRYNFEVHNRALETIKNLTQTTGVTKPPLTIAMVTLDSFSRRHFFRKCPRVVEKLNQLEAEGEWKVFDFKLHNIIGSNTAENQSNVFGQTYRGMVGKGEVTNTDFFGSQAIWKLMKKRGFVTLLGFEACAYKMNRVLGRKPKADHVVNPFFCAAERYSSYNSHKRQSNAQRCMGVHMSHWYLMNYTLAFIDSYKDVNHWAYNHITSAHEETGQHAVTVDKDLLWYLESLIERAKDRDMIIYVLGDHGMRYGNFISNTEAIQESRLPVFFLLGKREHLDRIEYSYDTLTHNTFRLTSKPDLRRSLLYLADLQYGLSRPNDSKHPAINLFTEKASNTRTCEGIDIPSWYCSTYALKPVSEKVYNDSEDDLTGEEQALSQLVKSVSVEIVQVINSFSYGAPGQTPGQLCKKLTFDRVSLVIAENIPDTGLIMKLSLKVKESQAAIFDSVVLIKRDCDLYTPPMELENYSPFPLYYRGEKLCVKLISVMRTDVYTGKCEGFLRELGINPEFCICTQADAEEEQAEDIA